MANPTTAEQTLADKFERILQNVPRVFASGQQNSYRSFWNVYQENGNRTAYDYGFYRWHAEDFKPLHSIIATGSASHMFANSTIGGNLAANLSQRDIRLDTSAATDASSVYYHTEFTHVPVLDLSGLTAASANLFGSSAYLKTIDGIKFNSSSEQCIDWLTAFRGCYELVEVSTITATETTDGAYITSSIHLGDCEKLNKQTVELIFAHLSGAPRTNWCTWNEKCITDIYGSTTAEEFQDLIEAHPQWNFAVVPAAVVEEV